MVELRSDEAPQSGPVRPATATSAVGQKAKYSLRAHIVCFAPESGLKTDIAGGPFRANTGLLALLSATDLSVGVGLSAPDRETYGLTIGVPQ
jgi:hypothetical protein